MTEIELKNIKVGHHVKFLGNNRVYMVINKISLYCVKVINPLCVGFTDFDFITIENVDKWVLLND